MAIKFRILILLTFPILVGGQINIKGVVIDRSQNLPISFATVYINETTKGTITEEDGSFILNNVKIPAQLIVSHLSYLPFEITIENSGSTELTIYLDINNNELPELIVEDQDYRRENVKEFEKLFLGTNYYGKRAFIENESCLFFEREYSIIELPFTEEIAYKIDIGTIKNKDIIKWDKDSSVIMVNAEILKVSISSPLKIGLPLLGYELQVDNLDFFAQYIGEDVRCQFFGYYYYRPYETTRKKQIRRYLDARETAYFNSSHHFLHALFHNQLLQNGYQLIETYQDKYNGKPMDSLVNIEQYLGYIDNHTKSVEGMQDRDLKVIYFCDFRGFPLDLTRRKGSIQKKSVITFLDPLCLVRTDGTIPNSNIIFGGEIGEKRVGSMLPSNYSINE